MSTLKVNNIQNASGTDAISIGSDGSLSYPNIGRRNLIINGAMRIAQRGTSFLNNGTNIANVFGADRFRANQSGLDDCDISISNASTNLPEFPNSIKFTVETAESSVDADDRAYIDYAIEAQDLQHLQYGTSSAQDVTLSFWIKSSVTGTYAFFGYQPDSSPAKMFNANYTVDSANTWEKKIITIPGDTSGQIDNNNLQGLYLRWFFFAGSNWTGSVTLNTWKTATGYEAPNHNAQVFSTSGATLEITGVQLEVGSVATPFEHRSYGEELALCRRYFIKKRISGIGFTPTGQANIIWNFDYPNGLRATPSLSYTATDGTANYLTRGFTGLSFAYTQTGYYSHSEMLELMYYLGSNGNVVQGDAYEAIFSIDAEL